MSSSRQRSRLAFFATDVTDLNDPERRFPLSAEDIRLLNPNTRTCPIFRTRRDAEITKYIYRRVPVLINENKKDGNPWGVTFMAMLHMSNDSGTFPHSRRAWRPRWELEGNVFRNGEALPAALRSQDASPFSITAMATIHCDPARLR